MQCFMSNLVEFPGLGLSMNINRVAFTILGMPIYWYGIIIATGMMLAMIFAFSQATRFGISKDRMVDVIIIGFILAIIGARVYFIIFSDIQYNTFFDFINLRAGGLAIYGGIIGAMIGAAIGCTWRKVPLLPMLDVTSMGFLIGQSIGRWANFVNQEAFGTNTTRPWGMISPATTEYLRSVQAKLATQGVVVDPYAPVHPTFLYESIWCAIGFLLLFIYRKHRKFNGEIGLMYVFWYGIGRFFIEGLRTDSLMFMNTPLRSSQVLGITSALAALVVWIIARVKTAGKPLNVPEIPPMTAKVKVQTDGGPKTLVISWPANDKAPNRQQQELLARQMLEAENAEKGDDTQETPAHTEPEESPATEEKKGDENDA